MLKQVLLSAVSLLCVEASTKVVVVEYGSGGCVHRSPTSSLETTVGGVYSFWAAAHEGRRSLQEAGMALVPDLFKKSDSGIALGLSGGDVDLDVMPFLSGLVSEHSGHVVGHMEVAGARLDDIMSRVRDGESVDLSNALDVAKKQAEKAGLSGLKAAFDPESLPDVDIQVKEVLAGLEQMAQESKKSIVVHLVFEDKEPTSRRLEENNGNDGNGNGNGNANYDGYYGYGYYDANQNWVSTYKSMFQIQYYNIVLWTAIGLAIIIVFTINLMINMPLEPDTLLFGESARLPSDD